MSTDTKLAQMLLETFQEEMQELHQSLIDSLLSIEKAQTAEALKPILETLFRYSHNMKGAAACASVDTIATMAHRLEDLFSEWRKKRYIPKKEQINACLEVVDNTLLALQAHCNGENADIENWLAPLRGGKTNTETRQQNNNDYIKLPLRRIEQATAKANEFITYGLKIEHWFKEIDQSLKELIELENHQSVFQPLIKKMTTISVESGQFFGEFSRSVKALQDELKSMCMMPISNVLTPLARTVRDVAASLNKSVELQVDGGDIEIDKTIIDILRDPLQHLIRNAIAHGIESDLERKELNKPVPAQLKIHVSQTAGKIKLKLSDDGQGINIKKIKKKAVSLGIYSENDLKKLDDTQILECIFHSGFSLQDKVTELSGRGVGLDAVKNDIQKIKGSITLETKQGQGSSFALVLPLTLATTRGVFFRIKEQIFMLPTHSLKALYEIKQSDLQLVDNKYILVVNKTPIPVKGLSPLLGMEALSPQVDPTYYGLLMDHSEKPLILLVDFIMDERNCVVNPLPFPFSKLEQYIGATLTADNELVLVINPARLMQIALSSEAPWFGRLETMIVDKKDSITLKKKVLVVDDSLTSRSLCSHALEAAGYKTTSVVDGKKAWALFQSEAFDCVVTDIIMPEMDGFELTERIKTDKKNAHVPVIIVSTLDSIQDKQRGLEAGANAFLVKSEFDTHTLLEMMGSLL